MPEVTDVIDTIEQFNTFDRYPFATLVHLTVGIICGWLSERAKQLASIKMPSSPLSLQALLIGIWWIAYETVEFAREHDNGDADIAMGLMGVFIGVILCKIYPPLLIHFFAKPRNHEENDDDS